MFGDYILPLSSWNSVVDGFIIDCPTDYYSAICNGSLVFCLTGASPKNHNVLLALGFSNFENLSVTTAQNLFSQWSASSSLRLQIEQERGLW